MIGNESSTSERSFSTAPEGRERILQSNSQQPLPQKKRPRQTVALIIFSALALLVLAIGAAGVVDAQLCATIVIAVTVGVAGRRFLFTWPRLIVGLLVVMLFIPVRRYEFIGSLPFELEPYRLYIGILLVGWIAALLSDSPVQLRSTPFGKPLVLVFLAALASIAFNSTRVGTHGGYVMKDLIVLVGFLLLYAMTVSVIKDRRTIDTIIMVLVLGSSIVAFFAIIEANNEWNIFDNLQGWVPGLSLIELPEIPERGVRLRAYASAQHPIALSALLAMCVPLCVYLWKRRGSVGWLILIAVLFAGTAATASRTGFVMLATVFLLFLWMRPREAVRFAPLLIPAAVLVQLTMPGTLGSLYQAFFPEGGLVAEQEQFAGQGGSGRVADLGPSLEEWSYQPLFGQGFGTRVIDDGPDQNALILDNQWLVTLLETGALGFIAWAWFLGGTVFLLGRASKKDDTAEGWLMSAVAAAIGAYLVGMVTYDSFDFIQVTFVAILLAALGASVYISDPTRWPRNRSPHGSSPEDNGDGPGHPPPASADHPSKLRPSASPTGDPRRPSAPSNRAVGSTE